MTQTVPLRYLNIIVEYPYGILFKEDDYQLVTVMKAGHERPRSVGVGVCVSLVCMCVDLLSVSRICCFSREGISPVPLLFRKVSVRKFLSFTVAIRQLRSCH